MKTIPIIISTTIIIIITTSALSDFEKDLCQRNKKKDKKKITLYSEDPDAQECSFILDVICREVSCHLESILLPSYKQRWHFESQVD